MPSDIKKRGNRKDTKSLSSTVSLLRENQKSVKKLFLGSHLEDEFSTLDNVVMSYEVLLVTLAVKENLVNIKILLAQSLGLYSEDIAVGHIERDARKLGRTKNITAADRIYGIEAHSREDVPSRHLTAIVVSAKAIGRGTILGVKYFTHKFRSTVGASGHAVEIDNVVAGLVAVSIVAKQSTDISHIAGKMNGKERIQFGYKFLATAKKFDKAGNIMLHVPCILP